MLDSSINALLIVTAASHLLCQELLHASLMPTANRMSNHTFSTSRLCKFQVVSRGLCTASGL